MKNGKPEPAPRPAAGEAADPRRAWLALAEWLVAARATLAGIEDAARAIVSACERDPKSPFQELLTAEAVNELANFASDLSDADSYLANVVLTAPPGAMPDPIAALAGGEGGGR